MDFNHNENRQMLADSFGRYLQQRYPIEERHRIAGSQAGWSREHWNAMAALGIVGALFDEEAGGFGGTGFDIAVVFEQLGRALSVEPFLGTLMSGRALQKAGGQEELLNGIIAGTTLMSLAHEEHGGRYDPAHVDTRAERRGGSWSLTGNKTVVPQLEASDRLLVSARIEDGVGLFLVKAGAPGVSIRGFPMIDGGRGGELALENASAILISDDGLALIEEAVAAGIVALVWEAVGIMDVLKSSTLEYLCTRRQFGVPIGKFQALQHRMANLALEMEQARSAAINASAALGEDRVKRERAVSAAKYTIGRVGTLVAEESIQMHGGIGMTWELPLSHYAKRAIMIGHQLGDEDHHLGRFISLGRAA